MKYIRINENELLEDNHMPIMMLFNLVDDIEFLRVAYAISQGNGFGEDIGACTMPDDLDDYDKANGECLDGVEFALYSGEEVVIDFKTFLYYYKLVISKYLEKYPEKTSQLEKNISDYSKKFL